MTRTGPRARRRHLVALSCLVLLVGGTAGCTDSAEPPSGDESSSAPPPPAPPLATTVTVGVVKGRMAEERAGRAARHVARVVDGWLDAAYVAGDYPRTSFADAFPGFSPGAAEQAARDERLMTNADIGARIESATAKVRRVTVDLLATRGAARGATARVKLVFVTEGQAARRVTVTGRLALTPTADGWQVFAYDIAKGSS